MSKKNSAVEAEALLSLYQSLNSPYKAGRKWVSYERSAVEAALDVVRQLLQLYGATFVQPGDGDGH